MDINFIESIINLLVPDKRTRNTIAFLSPIASEIQLNSNVLDQVFKTGAEYVEWSSLTTYNKNDLIKYGKAVYYSAVGSNLNNIPGFSEQWILATSNFIGTDKRIFYNGTKLVFEYAINTFFGTVYNPNTTINSEIYTETIPALLPNFRIASTEPLSSSVFKSSSTGVIKLTNNQGFQYNLIIWVKDLDTVGKPTTNEIKTFADKYINAGIRYIIQSY